MKLKILSENKNVDNTHHI